MINKQYAVLGLGRFGTSVALTLAEAGCEVLAVDTDEEKVQELADHVTYAVTADVTEPGVLESLSVSNIDVAVIGIAGNMEDSILATIMTKEAGAGYVIAKAMSEIHGTILEKVGADKVIYPGNRNLCGYYAEKWDCCLCKAFSGRWCGLSGSASAPLL